VPLIHTGVVVSNWTSEWCAASASGHASTAIAPVNAAIPFFIGTSRNTVPHADYRFVTRRKRIGDVLFSAGESALPYASTLSWSAP
jgi:hypothetical protein